MLQIFLDSCWFSLIPVLFNSYLPKCFLVLVIRGIYIPSALGVLSRYAGSILY